MRLIDRHTGYARLTLNRHKSIIAYLTSVNLTKSAGALREELDIGDAFDDATSKKYEGLLEKKWTSIVRLQKKVRLLHKPCLPRAVC